MCGIDELFGSQSLDEKTESTERFTQALNEYGASGDFRKLLKPRFASSWRRELGTIENIEAALKNAQEVEELPCKISLFVQTIAGSHSGGWLRNGFFSYQSMQAVQKRYPSRVAFAQEVAAQVFPTSPYGFHQCFKGSLSNFEDFVLFFAPAYYGESCHLTPLLFNDKSVSNSERHKILFAVFIRMVEWDCSFIENLKKLFIGGGYVSVPTRETLLFSSAFEYLYAWLEADAQSQEFIESRELLDYLLDEQQLYDYSQNTGALKDACAEEEWQAFKNWAGKWLDEKRHKLSKAWCCNVKLAGLADDDFDYWARKSYDCYLPLCQDLNEERAALLIAWGIDEDLKKWLNPKLKCDYLLGSMLCSEFWYVSAFRETWRTQLIGSIRALSFEGRLSVLGRHFGFDIRVYANELPQYISLPQHFLKQGESDDSWYEFQVESADREWWDSLLHSLPDDESFPRELYPFWTLEALTRFGHSKELVFFADKSLGIVRGDISTGDDKFKADDVGRLIKILERYAPEKAVRHRLLLLRNSQRPFATENLDIDRNSLCPKSMSEILQLMLAAHFDHESKRHLLSGDKWDSEELRFLSSIRAWVVQYCLSRLKLRKGEKVESGNYNPEQVIEPSAIWRKAYLKVFEELGVDLQGKVHKMVFFSRKFDPVEDVREVAKVCYKAVRREHNKSETAADIRRGLTAAYWWLLLAQRHTLELPINKEEAVKTRRRLLRRP